MLPLDFAVSVTGHGSHRRDRRKGIVSKIKTLTRTSCKTFHWYIHIHLEVQIINSSKLYIIVSYILYRTPTYVSEFSESAPARTMKVTFKFLVLITTCLVQISNAYYALVVPANDEACMSFFTDHGVQTSIFGDFDVLGMRM